MGGKSMFEYPTLAALMGLAWVVPQSIELESDPYSPYASGAFWLYITACFLFILWGFRLGLRARKRRMAQALDRTLPGFDTKRLLIAAAGLTALGQAAVFQMRGIDTSGMGGQWTGVITMWALLAKTNAFGLCLSILIFAKTGSRLALIIAIVGVIPIAQSAFLAVRREALFDLAILTAGAWYMSKNRTPPRGVVIACLVVGTIVLNSVGDIRGRVFSGEMSLFSVLTSSEIYRDFNYLDLGQGSASEVGLARYDFEYMNKTWNWEYGANYWNALANQYVPAFFLGRAFKDSLMIDTASLQLVRGEIEGAFSFGSTRTGFSDTYRSFGMFGVLVFAAIGYFFGVLYAIASIGGISGQYFYLVLLAEGLKAITHSTGDFLSSLPFTLIFSLLALRFSKARGHVSNQHCAGRSMKLKIIN